jgi:MoaA/NifB/PqqE/SkfB family radical SAM enzyme
MNDPEAIAADALAFREAVLQGKAYKPLYVKLKLVWNCNLRCGMCNHWRDTSEPPLNIDFFKSIVDELAELGCRKIHLSGGEATLRPNLEELIAYITARGIRVTMTTNATRINARRARSLVKAGLRKVNISIDSPNPKIHDQIRGVKGAWKKAVAGFRYLRPWLKPGKMRINTVVGQINYTSLVDLPDLAAEIGGDHLNLIPMDENTPDLQRLSHEEILDYNSRIAPVIAKKALAYGLIEDPTEVYPFGSTPLQIQQSVAGLYARGYYNNHRCFAPWTHALIDHVGRVSVCCMLPNKPVIGDLREQSFTEIWQGENFTALRNRLHLPQFETCKHCDHFLENNQRLEPLLTT